MLNSQLSVTDKVINHSHYKVPGWSVIVQLMNDIVWATCFEWVYCDRPVATGAVFQHTVCYGPWLDLRFLCSAWSVSKGGCMCSSCAQFAGKLQTQGTSLGLSSSGSQPVTNPIYHMEHSHISRIQEQRLHHLTSTNTTNNYSRQVQHHLLPVGRYLL